MAKDTKASSSEIPKDMANVTPIDAERSGQARILIDAVKENVADIKGDVRKLKDDRFSDLLWHIGGLVTLGVVFGGMLITAYFRIEDKIENNTNRLTKIETKLDDLLERISKDPASMPHR